MSCIIMENFGKTNATSIIIILIIIINETIYSAKSVHKSHCSRRSTEKAEGMCTDSIHIVQFTKYSTHR